MCVCPICVDKKFRIRYEKKRVFECDTFSKFILSSCRAALCQSVCSRRRPFWVPLVFFSLSPLCEKRDTTQEKQQNLLTKKKEC